MHALWHAVHRLWFWFRLWGARRQGLDVADDCRMEGVPSFGSEPFLVHIRRRVAFGPGVMFITHDGGTHVFRSLERYRNVIKFGHITIHDNCVIGARSILLPGVSVGPNSVVAAGSVVTRSIPPNVLAAGNPAHPVMSTEAYAEWSLADTPAYDLAEYRRDKKAVLLKLPIRGARQSPAGARTRTVRPAPPVQPAAAASAPPPVSPAGR